MHNVASRSFCLSFVDWGACAKYHVCALNWNTFIQFRSLSWRSRSSSRSFIVGKIMESQNKFFYTFSIWEQYSMRICNLFPKNICLIYCHDFWQIWPFKNFSLYLTLSWINNDRFFVIFISTVCSPSGFSYRRPGPHHFQSHGSEIIVFNW